MIVAKLYSSLAGVGPIAFGSGGVPQLVLSPFLAAGLPLISTVFEPSTIEDCPCAEQVSASPLQAARNPPINTLKRILLHHSFLQ